MKDILMNSTGGAGDEKIIDGFAAGNTSFWVRDGK
jgi:hypothetical protein